MVRSRILGAAGVFAVLIVLAAGVSLISAALVPTMGIVVVAAALFLNPAQTALLGAVATALSMLLTQQLSLDQAEIRVANVALASLLAIAASWALDRRVRSIQALRASESAVLQSVPDPIVVLDGTGRVLQANAALATLVRGADPGVALHPLLGHLLADGSPCPGGCVLAGSGPSQAAPHLVEGESVTRDGRPVPVQYSAGAVVGDGTVVCIRDVTQIVAADEDRRVLLEAAVRQREEGRILENLAPHKRELREAPGLEVDIWSQPASPQSASGRDVVDVSPLPSGEVAFLVVDAVGDGIVSTTDAWKVLYVAKALLAADVPLDEVVARSATTLAADPNPPSASVLAGVLDPQTGVVRLAAGGHPPALLVRANGGAQWLEATGTGLGATEPGSQQLATSLMRPGDWLVVYTDGVVDASSDVWEGLSMLRSAAVARRSLSPRGWARGLMSAVLPGPEVSGDATILSLRLSADRAA